MERSGSELKKKLGLSKIKSIKISRVIGYPVPIYYVWYDTARTIPLTRNIIKYAPIISRIRLAPYLGDDVAMTPLVDIEDFNANLSNGIYITIDLAGKRLAKDLLESITLKDLKGGNDLSDITQDSIQNRAKKNGSETKNSKLTGSDIIEDDAYFYFNIEPTSDEGDKLHAPILNCSPAGKLSASKDGKYHATLKLIDFMQWYETKPEGYEVKMKDIKEVLDSSYVQIFSDSPSFWFQGFAKRLSDLDGAIYTPTQDKGIWKKRHDNSDYTLLDKHTTRIINQIAFYRNQMASSISATLRKLGKR